VKFGAGACSGKGPLVWEIQIAEHAPMFLRKHRKSANGEIYEYWTLCETVRTQIEGVLKMRTRKT
jgi:hypothetical protein